MAIEIAAISINPVMHSKIVDCQEYSTGGKHVMMLVFDVRSTYISNSAF